jgi:hypothetical protein
MQTKNCDNWWFVMQSTAVRDLPDGHSMIGLEWESDVAISKGFYKWSVLGLNIMTGEYMCNTL